MATLSKLPEWQALQAHYADLTDQPLARLVAADGPARFEEFSVSAAGLTLDYSKNRMTSQTRKLLLALAAARDVEGWRARMWAGEAINNTEQRAALHVALRAPAGESIFVDGQDVVADVQGTLQRMSALVQAIRGGDWRGATGERISDVVNIGLGGSDLGPRMATEALHTASDGAIQAHFLANPDGDTLDSLLNLLRPERCLVIITSKSFTTQETLANAQVMREWLAARLGDDLQRHLIAVTANRQAAQNFGVGAEQVLPMWDWVGGRYSLWSAVGLPIALACGMPAFAQLHAGARAMDQHFRSAPLAHNMPVLFALSGIGNRNFLGAESYAVIPYCEGLRSLPCYLQQLDMESNGKGVGRDGQRVEVGTGPVVWGDRGTNAQHAFMQLVHQSSHNIPVDFIAALHGHGQHVEHQRMQLAHCLAQGEALLAGYTETELRADLAANGQDDSLLSHRLQPGNRPSNLILMDRLEPFSLGALIALYEHKVFVQGVIWGVNSFDQWGVERGKQLAGRLLGELAPGASPGRHDAATSGLLKHVQGRLNG